MKKHDCLAWASCRIGWRESRWLWDAYPVDSEMTWQRFREKVYRRMAGYPLAYLLETACFLSHTFKVTPATLVPRPDTEQWVSALLAAEGDQSKRVIELGTGSGAIAISLALAKPHWDVVALDCCPDALSVAQDNAHRLGASIEFLVSDWWQAVQGVYDLIVTNPPYLSPRDRYVQSLYTEPYHALVAEQDGLASIHAILKGCVKHLAPTGRVYLEHGVSQRDVIKACLTQYGLVCEEAWDDWGGQARCLVLSKQKK